MNRMTAPTMPIFLLILAAAAAQAAPGGGLVNPLFRRGDANLDGQINLSDASFLLDSLYLEGLASGCSDAADVNDDGLLNGADPLYLLDWLFPEVPGEEQPPPPPFTEANLDLTIDALGCLIPIITPPGSPDPGVKLEVRGPEVLTRGQQGVELFLSATTRGPIDGFSVALRVDHPALRVSGVDLQGTVFPEPQRSAFEGSDFFRWTVVPQPELSRDLLLVGAIFLGPDHTRIDFPATSGPLSAAPLVRLLVDVPPDAPLGERTVLENAPLPLNLAGPITELAAGGASTLLGTLPSYSVPVAFAGEFLLRGDANGDTMVDISDPVFSLFYLFQGDDAPSCLDTADANDDGAVEISDPIYLLSFLFTGSRPPPPPYPGCGRDMTPDTLPSCPGRCSG